MSTDPSSFPRKYAYFDRDGNPLSASRKDEKALKKLQKGSDGETALQAIERFEKVMKILEDSEDIDEEVLDDIDYCIPKFSNPVTEAELDACEQKFNVTLPPSYRSFVLKHGLIALDESFMLRLDRIEPLSTHLNADWDIDVTKDFPERSAQKTRHMLVFYTGPYDDTECFDFNTQNRRTHEVSTFTINHEEIYNFDHYYFDYNTGDMCQGSGFDGFISSLIDSQIGKIIDEIEEY